MDKFQDRYTAHQGRKAKVLAEIIEDRHSTRQFSKREIDNQTLDGILDFTSNCPSSCNRKAVEPIIVETRDLKNLLGGLLVGGTGWVHRADKVILLFADPIAYKAGDEIDYMPYLDAGIVVAHLYLAATSLGIKGCFVNPNIREMNKEHFKDIFGSKIFCGAFAIGYEKEE